MVEKMKLRLPITLFKRKELAKTTPSINKENENNLDREVKDFYSYLVKTGVSIEYAKRVATRIRRLLERVEGVNPYFIERASVLLEAMLIGKEYDYSLYTLSKELLLRELNSAPRHVLDVLREEGVLDYAYIWDDGKPICYYEDDFEICDDFEPPRNLYYEVMRIKLDDVVFHVPLPIMISHYKYLLEYTTGISLFPLTLTWREYVETVKRCIHDVCYPYENKIVLSAVKLYYLPREMKSAPRSKEFNGYFVRHVHKQEQRHRKVAEGLILLSAVEYVSPITLVRESQEKEVEKIPLNLEWVRRNIGYVIYPPLDSIFNES
jgi:hypothetical protein